MIPIITTYSYINYDNFSYGNLIDEYDFNGEEWIDVTEEFDTDEEVIIICIFTNIKVCKLLHNELINFNGIII